MSSGEPIPYHPKFSVPKRPVLQWSMLAVILAIAIAYQIRLTADIIRGEKVDVDEFTVKTGTANVEELFGHSREDGLRVGDQITAVNGAAYTGLSSYSQPAASAEPGDQIKVNVMRDGQPLSIILRAREDKSGFFKVLFDLSLAVLMPFFCILLACWVVFVRPRDISAWMLLGLLLGFSQLLDLNKTPGWPTPWNHLGTAYRIGLMSAWPGFMFLFGFFFPEPFAVWRKGGWRAWGAMLPVLPVCASIVLNLRLSLAELTDYRSIANLNTATAGLQTLLHVYTYLIVSAFFTFIFIKSSVATTADSRRRLRLLYWGMSVAMFPGLIVTVAGLLAGKSPSEILPQWIIYLALMMLLLAPLTFGYVIVVQRAMDVRVVVRQGLQYGLASRGLLVIQFVLVGGVAWAGYSMLQHEKLGLVWRLLMLALWLLLLLSVRRGGDRLREAVDRRFFREAYNAEQVLSELSDQVRGMVETRSLIQTVAARIASTLHVSQVAVLTGQDGPYLPAFVSGFASPPNVRFDQGSGAAKALQREKNPARVYLDDPNSWLYRDATVTEGDRSQLAALHSELLLPLSARESLLGFISLGPKLSEEPYSPNDVQLLKSVAAQTGLALDNARLMSAIAEEVAQRERLNREVEIAREVQERLFPQKFPPIAGLEYAGACRPALGVGGDYYDFLALPGGKLGVAIGDVSGKGIAAALMMASLQASLRGEATRATEDLAAMIGAVNRLVYEASQSNRYATFFYAQYDPATRKLHYVNAGHNPPIILKRSAKAGIERLEATGTVVGLLEQFPYMQGSCDLAPGDLFVGFTDGISEAMNSADEEWGEDRLIATLEKVDGKAPGEVIADVMNDADEFVAGAKQHDDMTLVVLRALG